MYSDPKCNDGMMEKDDFLNYFALIVGYGITPGQQQFWNVKTSLGTNWGEEGYIRIAKGIPTVKSPWGTFGMCGVAGFTGLIRTWQGEPITFRPSSVGLERVPKNPKTQPETVITRPDPSKKY